MDLSDKTGGTVGFGPMNDRIEESVTQNGTDYVLSLSDHIRYVVAEVHDAVFAEIVFDGNAFLLQTGAFPVVGLVRDEDIFTHLLSVQVELEIAEAGSVKTSRSDRFVDREGLPQQRCGWRSLFSHIFQRLIALPRSSDPLSFPFGGVEDAHAPISRSAPFGCFPVVVPYSDAPPADLPRLERLPFVLNEDRLIAFGLFAVPEVGFPIQQCLLRRGYLNLPCTL